MSKVIILGTANAVPDESHENSHLVVQAGTRTVLVDCPGSPTIRLKRAGIKLENLTDLILTHFHPDHISGFPSLLMTAWLMGRTQPLNVYGLDHTLDRAGKMLDLYDWQEWPRMYPVHFIRVPETEDSLVLSSDDLKISSTPGIHIVPSISLRFEFINPLRVITYSSDTEPNTAFARLSGEADIVIHEASGRKAWHSSAEQAGEIAAQAGAKALWLIHYPVNGISEETLMADAKKNFSGKIIVARDFMDIEIT